MAKAIGISESTVSKWARADKKTGAPAWLDQRKELDRQAQARADELIVEDQATQIREMRKRHLQVAKELFFKSSNQLLGKVKNPKTGQMEVPAFETESQALQGLRLAMAAEQALLLRKVDPDAPGGVNFNGPAQVLLAGGGGVVDMQSAQRSLKALDEKDLRAILDLDTKGTDGAGKPKKTGGS
jgi:predicted transcriptional regulator